MMQLTKDRRSTPAEELSKKGQTLPSEFPCSKRTIPTNHKPICINTTYTLLRPYRK